MKIELSVGTGVVGGYRKDVMEIPDEELEGMTEDERDDYIEKNYAQPWLWEQIDWSWWKKE